MFSSVSCCLVMVCVLSFDSFVGICVRGSFEVISLICSPHSDNLYFCFWPSFILENYWTSRKNDLNLHHSLIFSHKHTQTKDCFLNVHPIGLFTPRLTLGYCSKLCFKPWVEELSYLQFRSGLWNCLMNCLINDIDIVNMKIITLNHGLLHCTILNPGLRLLFAYLQCHCETAVYEY